MERIICFENKYFESKYLFKDNIFETWYYYYYYNGSLFRIFRLIWQQLKDHRRFKQGQKLLLIAEAMILPR